MSGCDEWSWWRDALAGKMVDSEVGNPRSGFWKASQDEPIAIWRDKAGRVCCERMLFGGGERMSLDKIDALYASASRYPIDEATYDAARAGNPPHGFKTRLSVKECQANVVWSLELGRKKLGADPQSGEVTDEVAQKIGTAAQPPADTTSGHTFDGERTPELAIVEEVSALGASVKAWLISIHGTPRSKAEADIAGDYKTRFAALEKKADKARVDEKDPHLTACRDVDAKWKRPIANAKASKEKCAAIVSAWMDAENAKLAAEADRVNAEAVTSAARAAKQYDAPVEPPPPVQAERVTSVGNMRQVAQRERTAWIVDDPREYLRHLLTLNSEDLPVEIIEALSKVASRREVEAPGVSKKTTKVAA